MVALSTNRSVLGETTRRNRRLSGSAILVLVLLVVAAFSSTFGAHFVNLDDDRNFIYNAGFRGLGREQFEWMFTTSHMGHFQPLSWLTFGLDFELWGLDAAAYHAASVAWHALHTVVVYFLALAVLRRSDFAGSAVTVGAALAAALFAVHPLRVESVAWVTGRNDVIAGLFFSLGMIAWLRHAADTRTPCVDGRSAASVAGLSVLAVFSCLTSLDLSSADALALRGLGGLGIALALLALGLACWLCVRTRRRGAGSWAFALACLCILLSLLGKAYAMVAPVVFLILDVWPLQRWSPRMDRSRRHAWGLIAEKTPFFALGAVFGVLAAWAKAAPAGTMKTLAEHSIGERLVQAIYGLAFYPRKTIVPTELLPIYDLPATLSLLNARYLVPFVAVISVTAVSWRFRKQAPWALTSWVTFAVLISPVLGLLQSGSQLVADRYSYIACLPFAMLAGCGWSLAVSRFPSRRHHLLGAAAVLVGILAILTWKQASRWRDSETLYGYAIEVGESPRLITNLAMIYNQRAQEQPAQREPFLARALQLSNQAVVLARQHDVLVPDYQLHRGTILYNLGRSQEAVDELQSFVRQRPDSAEGLLNLGLALNSLGRHDSAAHYFERATRSAPTSAAPWRNLGRALEASGAREPARRAYLRARELAPEDAFVESRLRLLDQP